ncbi:hypothetical protein [Streptomyces kurssanovii]|uniref:Uncharacterized protein n=1 Tax=Streptomyces kurssanovii TaxID=67312 RepID=A0ABV3I280_9ACTN
MAAAVAVGGAAASASAAPSSPSIGIDGPGGHGGGHGERPIMFGPFEIPRNGNVSAGFQWGTSNGGGFGF